MPASIFIVEASMYNNKEQSRNTSKVYQSTSIEMWLYLVSRSFLSGFPDSAILSYGLDWLQLPICHTRRPPIVHPLPLPSYSHPQPGQTIHRHSIHHQSLKTFVQVQTRHGLPTSAVTVSSIYPVYTRSRYRTQDIAPYPTFFFCPVCRKPRFRQQNTRRKQRLLLEDATFIRFPAKSVNQSSTTTSAKPTSSLFQRRFYGTTTTSDQNLNRITAQYSSYLIGFRSQFVAVVTASIHSGQSLAVKPVFEIGRPYSTQRETDIIIQPAVST
jgi:hypothetical protein